MCLNVICPKCPAVLLSLFECKYLIGFFCTLVFFSKMSGPLLVFIIESLTNPFLDPGFALVLTIRG